MSNEYCFTCHAERRACDDDPNGDYGGKCARCVAEEQHDYDRDPDVFFTRDGSPQSIYEIQIRATVNYRKTVTVAAEDSTEAADKAEMRVIEELRGSSPDSMRVNAIRVDDIWTKKKLKKRGVT